MRLYFKDSRPASGTYRAPSSYQIQYYNGSAWVNAAAQVKTPASPQGNYNNVRFTAVDTQRIRVLLTHAGGSKAGLTEMQVYNRGGTIPPPRAPRYEAEASGNTLAGQAATRTSPDASGGSLVGYVGDGTANTSSSTTSAVGRPARTRSPSTTPPETRGPPRSASTGAARSR